MALDPSDNFAETELSSGVNDTTNTFPVVDATVFPNADTEGAFNVLVWNDEENINPVEVPTMS